LSMERYVSGSFDEGVLSEVEAYVNTDDFEENLILSFSEQYYFLNDKAPNPFWVFSSSSNTLIRLSHDTELLLLEDFDADQKQIECVACQNIVYVPTEYITEAEWH
jgi:hypothetical protein